MIRLLLCITLVFLGGCMSPRISELEKRVERLEANHDQRFHLPPMPVEHRMDRIDWRLNSCTNEVGPVCENKRPFEERLELLEMLNGI